MRQWRGVGIAASAAAVALGLSVIVSGGPAAKAASVHSRPARVSSHVFGLAGTLTFSGHGSGALIAGTTVAPGQDGASCIVSPEHLRTTDSYSFSGHGAGQLGGLRDRTQLSAKLLGLAGTSGCSATGVAGTSFACTASADANTTDDAHVRGDSVTLTVSTLISPAPDRAADGEHCFGGIAGAQGLPVTSTGSYLEVGAAFTFSLSGLEKSHAVSVTLDSHRTANCTSGDDSLPAHARVCVDPLNAKDESCSIFAAPPGGSASCALTNHWVEKITFHLSQVCSTPDLDHARDVPTARERDAAIRCSY